MSYIAANGQDVTEAMIDLWCESYEKGEFPAGEHTAGEVVYGRPPLSREGSAVVSVKVPIGMKLALERKASDARISSSEFARQALADKILAS